MPGAKRLPLGNYHHFLNASSPARTVGNLLASYPRAAQRRNGAEDGGRPHRRPEAAFSRRVPAHPLAHPLKTRCRPVSGRLAQVEPGGGRKAPLFVRRLADNEPKARPQPSRTRCFTPKRAPDLAAVRYENHLRIVSVSCIISVLIRYTSIRYERSNDHGASGNYF